jgi:EAL domain-containing protein (putative c-di-GMP-specific phosphodiesterase class I)
VRPNIMKLDGRLIRSVDSDPMKFALVATLTNFAHQFGCKIVVEGVETEGELRRLRRIPVQAAQGFHLGRPDSADALLARLRTAA